MGKLVFKLQKIILWASYHLFRLFLKPTQGLWVIGVDEIANTIENISKAFARSYTVNMTPHKYYSDNIYDFSLKAKAFLKPSIIRLLAGPVLLGYLINRADNFFYIGASGFLLNRIDGREHEFAFLKKRGKKIVAFFCGSDIRSPLLSLRYAREHDIDVMATYQVMLNSKMVDTRHENFLKRVAGSADTHADEIFNAPVDQISYLRRHVHPFVYFYPDEKFGRNDGKFLEMTVIKIVHAPSSPFIKGTPIVRAAVKKLKLLGYAFDYVEIINQTHGVVLDHLREAHIVLNEFYAFVPGMFGIEAMANHCALLTSADGNIEKTLPEGANEAWFVTRYWDIFDHLKALLDDPALMRRYADKGYEWAYEHCRVSQSRKKLTSMFDTI